MRTVAMHGLLANVIRVTPLELLIVGVVMLVVGIALVIWNERRNYPVGEWLYYILMPLTTLGLLAVSIGLFA